MALAGDARTATQADPAAFRAIHVPPPYFYRCPFGTSTDSACGEAAADCVGRAIDERGAAAGAAGVGGAAARPHRARGRRPARAAPPAGGGRRRAAFFCAWKNRGFGVRAGG